jgi:hypothetical protein
MSHQGSCQCGAICGCSARTLERLWYYSTVALAHRPITCGDLN